jgi:hypothetical protein
MICAALAALPAACGRIARDVQVVSDPAAHPDELWQAPSDIASRDLFHGAGGTALRPCGSEFTFVARDTGGWSPGFDVRASDKVEWSVKLGPEAQSEVVSSRILWAIGYHQPPIYYLPAWMMTGTESGPQPAGRFRPTLPDRTSSENGPGTKIRSWARAHSAASSWST